jgi:ParB family chromosome partitioning protein
MNETPSNLVLAIDGPFLADSMPHRALSQRLKLAIADITVTDRQREVRKDFVENDLAPSMKRIGLIQPIVVNADNRLIAGGQRLAAAKYLGWTEIDIVYKETLSEDDLQEMELVENISRSQNTWQETCIAVAKIHALRKRRAVANGEDWTQEMTGRLFNKSKTNTSYCMIIARRLLSSTEDPMWKCDNMNDAWRLIYREEMEKNDKYIADQAAAATVDQPQQWLDDTIIADEELDLAVPPPDSPITSFAGQPVSKDEVRERYLANPKNDPSTFESYWQEREANEKLRRETVHLSNRFFRGDSIEFMLRETNKGRFDHLITDIPYGIDMEHLNQQNPHGGMVDIETVEAEHTVEGNTELMKQFFPAAYRCLKDNAYCITWCDQMLWQYMYDLATAEGFKVQRWPITWHKLHRCMNQCAQFNWTKTTEIAMVCRKGNAVLIEKQGDCVIRASNDEMRTITGHPFAKPYECWEFLAKAVSIEGQHILDPFVGRGSSALSMLRMKRIVTGVEIKEEHYNRLLEVLKRWYISLNPNFKFV